MKKTSLSISFERFFMVVGADLLLNATFIPKIHFHQCEESCRIDCTVQE